MRRAVDWREVERELEELPDEFKDQGSFDSLPHVVEILRTLDPSQALGELSARMAAAGPAGRRRCGKAGTASWGSRTGASRDSSRAHLHAVGYRPDVPLHNS